MPKEHSFLQTKNFLLFSIAIIFLLSFLAFSLFIAKGRFINTDFNLTVKVQDKFPRSVDAFFSTLSILAQAEIIGIFWIILFIFLMIKRYYLSAAAMFLLPVALFIELIGKVYIHHPAPPHLFYRGIFDFKFPTNYVHSQYSYPSGHVTRTAFLIIFVMGYLFLKTDLKKQLPFQLLLAGVLVTMIISRIYLGEHWTSDTIGGLFLGGSFGLLAAALIPERIKSETRISKHETIIK